MYMICCIVVQHENDSSETWADLLPTTLNYKYCDNLNNLTLEGSRENLASISWSVIK